MGPATVVLHNLWVADWWVAITVLGWSTLIKGVLRIGLPEFIRNRAQAYKRGRTANALMIPGLGSWLMWMSF